MSGLPAETGNFERHLYTVAQALDHWLASEMSDATSPGNLWQERLTGPVPERGIGADATIAEFVRTVLPNGPRLSSPTWWGWITTGPTTVPVVLSSAAMIAAPQRYTLTAFNRLEELSLEWLAQACSLGEHMKGVYSSGGSTANLVALGAARQWAFEQVGVDPSAAGLGGRDCAVYTSAESHHTVKRSAGVLGIGRDNVRSIPTDHRQRMDVANLRERLRRDREAGVVPIAIVATAGTTNTGAIDPLRAIGETAREFGAWFHVDGAYGLPGSLDERVTPLYDGLDLADSAIVDPHKWLGAPVGVAATFVRDRSILHRAFTQEPADYLEGAFTPDDVQVSLDDMGIPYADFGVELSSPSRGVMVWGVLSELGLAGLRRRVVTDNDFARHVARRAREHPSLEVLAEPVLSICGFRYTSGIAKDLDGVNAAISRRLIRETPIVISSTIVNGSFALRPCFINARTKPADVDDLIDTVVRLGAELTS